MKDVKKDLNNNEENEEDDLLGRAPKKVKKVENLKVYKLEDLNIGKGKYLNNFYFIIKGGNTPDCPFNCDCCF
jgi:hypothetical protein